MDKVEQEKVMQALREAVPQMALTDERNILIGREVSRLLGNLRIQGHGVSGQGKAISVQREVRGDGVTGKHDPERPFIPPTEGEVWEVSVQYSQSEKTGIGYDCGFRLFTEWDPDGDAAVDTSTLSPIGYLKKTVEGVFSEEDSITENFSDSNSTYTGSASYEHDFTSSCEYHIEKTPYRHDDVWESEGGNTCCYVDTNAPPDDLTISGSVSASGNRTRVFDNPVNPDQEAYFDFSGSMNNTIDGFMRFRADVTGTRKTLTGSEQSVGSPRIIESLAYAGYGFPYGADHGDDTSWATSPRVANISISETERVLSVEYEWNMSRTEFILSTLYDRHAMSIIPGDAVGSSTVEITETLEEEVNLVESAFGTASSIAGEYMSPFGGTPLQGDKAVHMYLEDAFRLCDQSNMKLASVALVRLDLRFTITAPSGADGELRYTIRFTPDDASPPIDSLYTEDFTGSEILTLTAPMDHGNGTYELLSCSVVPK